MANEELIKGISLPTAGDYSANQYRYGKVIRPCVFSLTGAGEKSIGVLQNAPVTSGEMGLIEATPGHITKVVCGDTVTAGDPLTSDGNGKAVTAGTGDEINGYALEDGTDGVIISSVYQ